MMNNMVNMPPPAAFVPTAQPQPLSPALENLAPVPRVERVPKRKEFPKVVPPPVQLPPHVAMYCQWMLSNDPSQKSFPTALVHLKHSEGKGGGVFASQDIAEGTAVFTVPKTMCYGVGSGGDPEVDSQLSLVQDMISHYTDPKWGKRVQAIFEEARRLSCTAAFCWPQAAIDELLKGTELECVVKAKLASLATEFKVVEGVGPNGQGLNYETFKHLCGYITSHVNPWWNR
jgi:hypothetical protein